MQHRARVVGPVPRDQDLDGQVGPPECQQRAVPECARKVGDAAGLQRRQGRPHRIKAVLGGHDGDIALRDLGLLLGGASIPLAVAGLIVAELFAGAFEPMIAQRVNTAITSAQRATVLSVEGFLYSMTMIWAFPLFGWTAERYGWLPAYGVAGGIVAALLGVFLVLGGGALTRPAGRLTGSG